MIIWTNYCTTNHIGKILHLDGDRRYTDKSSLYYKKAGLQAIVKYIPEYRQPSVIKNLLKKYNRKKSKSFEEIIEFHYMFERIHPFQDGNGRVGRLIMFKECLKNNIVPFIIDESLKEFYYRGLKEWKNERGHLLDTCLTAQDRFKLIMDYFGLNYK